MLKSMLRAYCVDTNRDWDDGIPLVLFAIREVMQESLGFSSAEFVFGHTVRGSLKLLKETLLDVAVSPTPHRSVVRYVMEFKDGLHKACELAKWNLSTSLVKMKEMYDHKVVVRTFCKGDSLSVFWGRILLRNRLMAQIISLTPQIGEEKKEFVM